MRTLPSIIDETRGMNPATITIVTGNRSSLLQWLSHIKSIRNQSVESAGVAFVKETVQGELSFTEPLRYWSFVLQ